MTLHLLTSASWVCTASCMIARLQLPACVLAMPECVCVIVYKSESSAYAEVVQHHSGAIPALAKVQSYCRLGHCVPWAIARRTASPTAMFRSVAPDTVSQQQFIHA